MSIDWFTVCAQMINFLFLVWLLKRFLYKPILRVVDERDKRVTSQLTEAQQIKILALKQIDEFKAKNDEFNSVKEKLLKEAKDAAQSEGERLIDQTRSEIEILRMKNQEEMKKEYVDLKVEVGNRVKGEVFAGIQKLLFEMTNQNLQEYLIDSFIARLPELFKNINPPSGQVTLRTAMDLSSEGQRKLEKAMSDFLKVQVQTVFEIRPDLIAGIELGTNEYRVEWNMANSLTDLEGRVNELFK